MKECPKNKQGGGNPSNRAQSSSVDLPDRAAPRGASYSTGRRAITSMQSRVPESKRTLQMFPIV